MRDISFSYCKGWLKTIYNYLVYGLYICMQMCCRSEFVIFQFFPEFQVLKGNFDSSTTNKNFIYHGVLTRWLRFLGRDSHGAFCLRVEVFGVKQKPGKTTMMLSCDSLRSKLLLTIYLNVLSVFYFYYCGLMFCSVSFNGELVASSVV